MILADKIIDLRKKNGWSQEELAEQLGVSRQSVSKWESGMSVPDLNKIIAMSELFCVSTDYLLKDQLEEATPSETEGQDEAAPSRIVTAEEANAYMETVDRHSRRITLGVALCILSPVVLLLLGGLAETGVDISDGFAAAAGMAVLLSLVGAAVALFIPNGLALSAYSWLDKEPFTLAYGVQGIVEKRLAAYRHRFVTMITLGVLLCIFSVMPLILLGVLGQPEVVLVVALCSLFCLCAVGVSLIVRACYVNGSYQRLLQVGEFTPESKHREGNTAVYEALSGAYWCIVTGVYLLWSILSHDWHITWIIWIIASGGQCIFEAIFHRKDD